MKYIGAGQDLQAALDGAVGGDVLALEDGATWEGVFELPENTSGTPITLTGAATIISSGTSQPAIKTRPKAHQWHLIGEPGKALTLRSIGVSEILRLGDGGSSQTLDSMPRGLRVEGLNVEGDEAKGAQRGISLQCGEAYVGRNRIINVRAANTESQGICGWNGTGPWIIEDNEINAGGMPFMAGGAKVSIPDVIPSGITFRRNHCWRPPEWQAQPYACKNLFEIKNGKDVICEHNLFEYCWDQGQRYAIALTPRVSENTYWASVKGVRIRKNRFIHLPGGVNLLGSDTNNAGSVGCCDDVIIEDNEFLDIDKTQWKGHGYFIQFVRGNRGPDGNWVVPTNIIIRRNIVENDGAAIFVDSGPKEDRTPIPGLIFTDNDIQCGKIRGNGTGEDPMLTVSTYLPESTITGNRLAAETCADSKQLPGNIYYETAADLQAEYMCWPGYLNLAHRPTARAA